MASSRLTVLAWHNVSPTPFFPGTAEIFADQLRAVRRVANVVPLGAALDDLFFDRPLPARAGPPPQGNRRSRRERTGE